MKIMTRQTSFEDEREANIKLCPGLKLKPLKLAIFQPVNAQIEISSLFTNNLLLSDLIIQPSPLRGPEYTPKDTPLWQKMVEPIFKFYKHFALWNGLYLVSFSVLY